MIYNEEKLNEKILEVGKFKAIEELYISYITLREDYEKFDDNFILESNQLIREFYEVSILLKRKGKVIEKKDVFEFANFIMSIFNISKRLKKEASNFSI
ncbi:MULTISPECIES: hypothetical protein [Staphylococcus]|uniref:hypothetical protein n=1 Tax=Staphylococcus TaxID=1279 RepID=UPI001A991AAF|nr:MULTISPECIES: hypothetical protein [Staphylococcus]MBO1207089.1 hypothetical protein [Staphylococcus nepalensis]